MVEEAEKYKAEDDANRHRVEAKNGLENYAYSMKTTLADEKLKDAIPEADKNTALEAIDEAIKWLDANQAAEKEEFEEKMKALEAVCKPIVDKLQAAGGAAPDMGGMPGAPPAGGAPAPEAASEGPTIEEID
jgi:L1 cell adhesion molecule like protein